MPHNFNTDQKIICGGVDHLDEADKKKLQGYVKLKTAVGGNLYCAFYTIAEGSRYLSIESNKLLDLIEKDKKNSRGNYYTLSHHINQLREVYDTYQNKDFNLDAQQGRHRSIT